MKQTAVEWLNSEVERLTTRAGIYMSWEMMDSIIRQAKQMEKNNLYECGSFWRVKENKIEKPFFEQWYNETYKSE